MIIEIKNDNHEEIKEMLKNAGVDFKVHDNVYRAVCSEEINNTMEYILNEKEANLDDSAIDELSNKLSEELYSSAEASESFQTLTETSELIISRALYNRALNNK